eukprot:352272-Chlamydomonas_euryale.AAC.1
MHPLPRAWNGRSCMLGQLDVQRGMGFNKAWMARAFDMAWVSNMPCWRLGLKDLRAPVRSSGAPRLEVGG